MYQVCDLASKYMPLNHHTYSGGFTPRRGTPRVSALASSRDGSATHGAPRGGGVRRPVRGRQPADLARSRVPALYMYLSRMSEISTRFYCEQKFAMEPSHASRTNVNKFITMRAT